MARQVPRRPSSAPPPAPKRSRAALAVAGAALVGLLAWTALGDPGPDHPGVAVETMPPSVVGTWTSADERYADRGLRITRDAVVILRGPDGPPVSGGITGIRSWREGGADVVLLLYLTEEGEEELEIHFETPDRMRLRNPSDVVWTRG